MNNCPKEILSLICSYSDPEELCCLSMTCKRLNIITKDDLIWLRHCGKEWLERNQTSKKSTHKDLYIRFVREALCGPNNVLPVEVQPKDSEYDIHVRILVQGATKVGKTSLISQYIDNIIPQTGKIPWDFRHKTVECNGTRVKLQMWDMSYLEYQRVRTIPYSYYRGIGIVMVLFSVTDKESFYQAKRQIEEVKKVKAEEDRSVFVVGNKKDLVDNRVISVSDGEELAKKYDGTYFESSAVTREGLEELFQHATQTSLNQILWANGPRTRLRTETIRSIVERKNELIKKEEERRIQKETSKTCRIS